MVPAFQKDPEGWGAADKFTVVVETIGLNATELGGYCRERGLYRVLVERWPLAAPTWPVASVPEALDANAQPLLPMADQKDLQKRQQGDHREIKRCNRRCAAREAAGTWHTALVGRNASGSC